MTTSSSSNRKNNWRFAIPSSGLRRLIMMMAVIFISVGVKAADDRCATPVILTSTGFEDVCPGVSTITITASVGDLISYTTDGSEPSVELNEAFEGPVSITVDQSMSQIRAVALRQGREASDVAEMDLYPLSVSRHTTFSEMFVAKDKGCLAGPYLIYAVEPLKDSAGSWVVLCEPDIRESVNCIVVEFAGDFQTAYPGLKVGETVDYVVIATYDEQATPNRGGMKRVTGCELPSRSCPLAGTQPELLQLGDAPDYWEDYYRLPVVLENVQVVDGMAYDLTVTDKFKNVNIDFDPERSYNLRGFVGTDIADKHNALRFFVMSYEEAGKKDDNGGGTSGLSEFCPGRETITVDGRPVLSSGQVMYDLSGRKINPATAAAGVYIIHSSAVNQKIVIR